MKMLSLLAAAVLAFSLLPFSAAAQAEDGQLLLLDAQPSGDGYIHTATLDGVAVPEYHYTWHIDPALSEPYYNGEQPSGEDAVYIAHDIYYYPLLDADKFQKVTYDGESEWVYFYQAQGLEQYIFSTLPDLRGGLPTQMMHTPEQAYHNAVLHITKAGTYTLKGNWHGQIRIDLGEDSFDDATQKVTLILDGVNIECTVAAGIVFAEVYECDNAWEQREQHSYTVDTADAGAVIRLADGSQNSISGTNVFRLLKPKYKDADDTAAYPAQKKLLKTDGALYSYRSLRIEGDSGTLNVTSGFEGINSELHLTLEGGNVNVRSQDDGINVNEDGVSVLTVNGGNLHICAGLGAEGDGIDSNGYLVINGGTVVSAANPAADSGMDSDKGSFVNGGTVVSLGSTMDWAKADGNTAAQAVLNLRFAAAQSADEAIIITDTAGKVLFAYDPDADAAMGQNGRTYSGAVLSAPTLKVGTTVNIYVGGNVAGEQRNGIYDIDAVRGFEGAARQYYTAQQQDAMGQRPEMPEGGFGERPEGGMGGEPPARPEGGMGGEPPAMPEGGFGGGRPEGDFGGQRPDMPQGGAQVATCLGSGDFVLRETVNAFSSVADLRHAPVAEDGCYRCTACGAAFADEACTQIIDAPADTGWLFYVAAFVGGAAAMAAAFVAVLLVRKKKRG